MKDVVGMLDELQNKALKNKEKIDKYGYWALLLFVAVPLPGSGGWTGALIASVLKMNRKKGEPLQSV